MSIPPLAYHRPQSLSEACALGRRLQGDGAFLAGGTELLPDYHRDRESARHLIALDAVPELRGIRADGDWLRIGALTTIADVIASPAVRTWYPVLRDAARQLGSAPIRSLATIGGNFCRAVACADMPPVAVAGGARLRLVGTAGQREVEAERFFVGPRQTILEPGEVLVDVMIPRQPAGSGASYQRFARRRGAGLAVAAVAARLTLAGGRIAEARISLGAVAPVPLLAVRTAGVLAGEPPADAPLALAAAVCAEEALPITDIRGSATFRRDLVQVLARRAFHEAVARAMGGTP